MSRQKNYITNYSLRPKILVEEIDVFRRILVLNISIFIHFSDKYFQTGGVHVMINLEISADVTDAGSSTFIDGQT